MLSDERHENAYILKLPERIHKVSHKSKYVNRFFARGAHSNVVVQQVEGQIRSLPVAPQMAVKTLAAFFYFTAFTDDCYKPTVRFEMKTRGQAK